MFGAKAFRVEVIDGVDLEEAIFLTGERVTIGSGQDDNLRLGGARIVPGHVVFAKSEAGKGWEYFTSGAGEVEISSGNPRTGPVKAGVTMTLGPDTVIKITREALPEELQEAAEDEKKEIPLSIALPVMAVFVVAFVIYIQILTGGGGNSGPGLRTQTWLTNLPNYGQALDVCLEAAGPETVERVPAGAPDAAFRAYSAAVVQGREADLPDLRLALGRQVRAMIVDAHLLLRENRFAEAADTLSAVPAMLPTGHAACPINSAARADFSVLERRASR